MQAYLLQAGSGKPRVAASPQDPAVCSPTVALRVLDSVIVQYIFRGARQPVEQGMAAAQPSWRTGLYPQLFPFQNEGPGVTNLLSSLD